MRESSEYLKHADTYLLYLPYFSIQYDVSNVYLCGECVFMWERERERASIIRNTVNA